MSSFTRLIIINLKTNRDHHQKSYWRISGDVVTKEGQVFYIDGKKMAVAKTHSLKGRPLQIGHRWHDPTGKIFCVDTPYRFV
jgi:hypothetical protein